MLHKQCPRCQGDMYLEEDIDGKVIVCLQCGLRRYASVPAYRIAPDTLAEKPVPAAR